MDFLILMYLVATNTGSLESLGGELLIFVRHEMHTQRELVDAGLLAAQIKDTDLGIGHTTAKPGLGVRLVLAVAITSCGTTTHL